MTLALEDYEAAYSRVELQLQLERDWGAAEARIRRLLRRPLWRLPRTIGFLALCLIAARSGAPSLYPLIVGLVVLVLPRRVRDFRERRRVVAGIESAEDVRGLCLKEARDASASALLGFVVKGGLGSLFLVFGVVLWLADKPASASFAAGLVTLAWGFVQLLVQLPRATREIRLLEPDGDAEDGATEDDDEEEDGSLLGFAWTALWSVLTLPFVLLFNLLFSRDAEEEDEDAD